MAPSSASERPSDGRVPARGHALAWTTIALFVLALAFGAWGLWKVVAPAPDDAAARLRAQQARIAELEQQAVSLQRSDQISRDANRDLQRTLAERDEEIASLRADIAFYERFVGATAQRHALGVHALQLRNEGGRAWHFTATLTQNASRDAVNRGTLVLSVEGSQGGRMRELDWPTLRQQADPPGVAYSFKYFQQVEGDILLPAGLQPIRITARLRPQRGQPVEQSFTWAEATTAPAADGRR
ncbi:MAG TPA: DUF6776 family protein [Xanthomonadaceae bacterium]|jgi:hypothetical protein|nr:DUF6776 family protein [Xanthomonadaceae bacterium]